MKNEKGEWYCPWCGCSDSHEEYSYGCVHEKRGFFASVFDPNYNTPYCHEKLAKLISLLEKLGNEKK